MDKEPFPHTPFLFWVTTLETSPTAGYHIVFHNFIHTRLPCSGYFRMLEEQGRIQAFSPFNSTCYGHLSLSFTWQLQAWFPPQSPERDRVGDGLAQLVMCLCKPVAGIEPTGNMVKQPARFTVDTISAGQGDVMVFVEDPEGNKEEVSWALPPPPVSIPQRIWVCNRARNCASVFLIITHNNNFFLLKGFLRLTASR